MTGGVLVGGVAAFNEEHRVAIAVRSLLEQELPEGWRWSSVVVVASGCTDRTADRAREADPRVSVVVQPERRGKASALREVFARARGDLLVLLNADAVAAPGSLSGLIRAAIDLPPPFAVMARPVPPETRSSGFGDCVALLWEVHHRFHEYARAHDLDSNLSDELLLLPVAQLPPLPEGVVNDGGFIGAWLRRVGGRSVYASDARVTIEVPSRFVDYVRQRRRIRWGLGQVGEIVGVVPSTLQRHALRHPGASLRLLVGAVRSVPRGARALPVLAIAETAALLLAGWDRLPPRRDHVRWVTLPD